MSYTEGVLGVRPSYSYKLLIIYRRLILLWWQSLSPTKLCRDEMCVQFVVHMPK